MPRMLRRLFVRERRLLRALSRWAWETLRDALRTCLGRDAQPGVIVSTASAGDTVNVHPHLHCVVAAGAWRDGRFLPWPEALTGPLLEELFRRRVVAMLVREERLHVTTAARLETWRRSGFSAFLGDPVPPWNADSRLRLARYLVKGPVALERLSYDSARCQVTVASVKRGEIRVVSGMDFLAELSAHVPDRGEQTVRYYGRYSNRARGTRRRQASGAPPPDPSPQEESTLSRKAFRLTWAALLKRVWDVDALLCRLCGSPMRVLAGTLKPDVIERILRHIGLWDVPGPPAPHLCPQDPHPLFRPPARSDSPPPDPDPGWTESDPPFFED